MAGALESQAARERKGLTRVLLSHGPWVAAVVASLLTLTYCTDRLSTETPTIELVERFLETELRSDALSLSILASMPRFQDRGFGPLERTERQARTWMLDREAGVVLFFDSASDKELSIRASILSQSG